ncbi:PQQ-like beta-propeller repeat protein, partial [candidate division KSB1 bacterium]|nr:PQQ-like beta-propeller repeat protein [candidate division KSB1 bacterium]
GYSGISVTNGKLYTMYGQGSGEIAICLDAASGEELWRFKMDSKYTNQWGHGPRATHTVDGNLVFVLSGKGKLFALNATKGTEVWGHDLHNEYGGKIPTWGVSTSPLVEGNMLIVDVGGKDGHGLVAFNKKDGKVIWKSHSGIPGYSAPIAVTVNGTRQILSFAGKALVSVSPKDGKQYWHYSWVTSYDVNAATPVFIKPDKVFISSGNNKGAAVLKMKAANGTVEVEALWKSRIMRNFFSSSILVGDHLYGFDEGTLRCVNVNTHESKWAKRGFSKGSLMYADGHLIVLSEKGLLVLVEATPEAFVQKASAQVLKGRCWTVPTLVNGMLYVRNQKDMLCLDLSQGKQS